MSQSKAAVRSIAILGCRQRGHNCLCGARFAPRNLTQIVRDYRTNHRPHVEDELRWYASLSPEDACKSASYAMRADGKRHDHQRRIPRSALHEVFRHLKGTRFGRVRSFEGLHADLERRLQGVHGVGPLFVYDTAMRLGARRRLRPKDVYLRAGTRMGAIALLGSHLPVRISTSRLPGPLSQCEAWELEDILCIFCDALEHLGTVGR